MVLTPCLFVYSYAFFYYFKTPHGNERNRRVKRKKRKPFYYHGQPIVKPENKRPSSACLFISKYISAKDIVSFHELNLVESNYMRNEIGCESMRECAVFNNLAKTCREIRDRHGAEYLKVVFRA